MQHCSRAPHCASGLGWQAMEQQHPYHRWSSPAHARTRCRPGAHQADAGTVGSAAQWRYRRWRAAGFRQARV